MGPHRISTFASSPRAPPRVTPIASVVTSACGSRWPRGRRRPPRRHRATFAPLRHWNSPPRPGRSSRWRRGTAIRSQRVRPPTSSCYVRRARHWPSAGSGQRQTDWRRRTRRASPGFVTPSRAPIWASMHGRGDPVASICVTEKTVMKTRGTRRRSAHQSRPRILVTSTASSTGSSRSCRRKRARPSSTLASRLAERTRWAYRLAIASHPFCTSRSTLTMSSKLLSGCTRDCAEIAVEIAAETAFRAVREIAPRWHRDCGLYARRGALPCSSDRWTRYHWIRARDCTEIAPRLHRDWTRDQWTRALTNASDAVRAPAGVQGEPRRKPSGRSQE